VQEDRVMGLRRVPPLLNALENVSTVGKLGTMQQCVVHRNSACTTYWNTPAEGAPYTMCVYVPVNSTITLWTKMIMT
jgi:hypothetical protein